MGLATPQSPNLREECDGPFDTGYGVGFWAWADGNRRKPGNELGGQQRASCCAFSR